MRGPGSKGELEMRSIGLEMNGGCSSGSEGSKCNLRVQSHQRNAMMVVFKDGETGTRVWSWAESANQG